MGRRVCCWSVSTTPRLFLHQFGDLVAVPSDRQKSLLLVCFHNSSTVSASFRGSGSGTLFRGNISWEIHLTDTKSSGSACDASDDYMVEGGDQNCIAFRTGQASCEW